jgi:ferritin-like metal-binding protein YciE
VEHYEIAAYGTARTHARQLGLNRAVNLLEQTLKEEKAADDLLANIAVNRSMWKPAATAMMQAAWARACSVHCHD